MKRILLTAMLVLLLGSTTLAAEDGLSAFLSHLDQPWALFFVIGATVSAIPLLILMWLTIRGLFNQRSFYPQTKKGNAPSR